MKTKEFLELVASANAPTKVRGVAYSGGKMQLGGWQHPVVVDLSGMTVPETVPLLANHLNHTQGRVGVISATVEDGTLTIGGDLLADGEDGQTIVSQAKAGAAWQLSIGAEVAASELVEEGTRTINGKEHTAPFYHITQSTLREVSVVAVGADRTTMMVTATATLTGEHSMNKTKKETIEANDPDMVGIQAQAAQAERERVMAIRAVCAGECPEVEEEAVRAGWSVEQATAKVLEAVRAKRPLTAPNVLVRTTEETSAKGLEAALCLRAGIGEEEVVKAYGERTVEAAAKQRDLPLPVVLAECLRLEGRQVAGGFGNDTIRAAFSTVSLPGILSNVANKKLLQSFRAQPILATKLCSEGDLSDFKETDRFRLTDVGDLVPLAPNGEIKHGGVVEESAKNQLDTYAKMFSLTRKMIINDDLNAFLQVPVAMGNRAARLIDQLFFKRLLANPAQRDGNALFHAKHGNLLSGATSVLSADALKKALQLFLDQVDADGQPISVEPKYLLVPTALKYQAIELTRGATLIMSGSDNTVRPAINVLADEGLQVVTSPYLANSGYPGASDAAWYLFGQPGQVDTFEIGYLRGRRTPTVESAETDFNTLGKQFRVYFDIGIREQDHRGMVKANGKA